MPAGGCDAGRKRIGVIECAHRRTWAQERRQRGLELEALGLREVGGLLDHAVADDAGEADADGVNGLAVRDLGDLRAHHLGNLLGGHALKGARRRPVGRVDAYGPDEAVIFHQTHRDVFHGQHADCTLHRGSRRRG